MIETLKSLFGMGPKVDFAQLRKAGAQIIDVRTPGEFKTGHIQGSVNIPLQSLSGSLSKIKQVLRITVYVNSARHFTQQSEVANGASDTFLRVLGQAGRHTRTSVGVAQLPKGATVELDLIAAV